MAYKVFTDEQIEHFIEHGWVKLEEAFPRENALIAQDYIWGQLSLRGVLKDDPSTWTQTLVHIKENYSNENFEKCNSQRFQDAIEDLVGEGRWAYKDYRVMWGWWPVNFPQKTNEPWTVPYEGWHFDGQHFRHYVNSWEQGLLCIPIFSEINHQGGATLIAEGTHHIVAKMLNEHPDGIEFTSAVVKGMQAHPWLVELTGISEDINPDDIQTLEQLDQLIYQVAAQKKPSADRVEKFMNTTYEDPSGIKLRVVEATGKPGDVYFCHPFLFHARSDNHSDKVRFMCNRTCPLKEPMNLNRDNPADYSPVELSIKRSLER